LEGVENGGITVPSETNGGPKGAKDPYWKVRYPGKKGWPYRYNMNGKPISPDMAHPGPKQHEPIKVPMRKPVSPWLLLFSPTPVY